MVMGSSQVEGQEEAKQRGQQVKPADLGALFLALLMLALILALEIVGS